MTTLAPKLPWQHAFAGGFSRLGGQALPTDADAIDYLNRVKAADGGVGVEVGVAQAIDVFVKGCKNDSANYAGDPTRTNWDALQACCIMAGARTISGALVPLKTPYGAELVDINNLPTPTILDNGSGVAASWNASSRTMTTDSTYTTSYPRFAFPGIVTQNKRYSVTGRVSGDFSDLAFINLGGSNLAIDGNGNISGTVDAVGATPFVTFAFNGTLGPSSVTIESLSVREDSFTPTAQGGWTSNEYSRGGTTPGLKGNGSTLYLDSNRANNADGQDDCHMAVYKTATGDNASAWMAGSRDRTTAPVSHLLVGSGGFYNRSNAAILSVNTSASTGLRATSRASSASATAYYSGTSSVAAVASVPASASANQFVFAFGTPGGTAVGHSDARLSFYSIGSACDLAALDARVSTLMAAIQAFLP